MRRRGTRDLPLLLVIERQTKGIAKGHQRSFHRIGLGLLDGGLMGLAQVDVDAVASAGAFSNQGRKTSGCDGDADAGGVGDAPAGLLISADGSFGLGNAADGDGLALPAVKTKDAVGFRDYLPTLQIAHSAAALLPLADFGPIQRSGQGGELLGGEAKGLSLEDLRRCG
jgi:hypothetical protein